MYLGTALKIALPLAMKDRLDLSAAYANEGEEADAARDAYSKLRALIGVRPAMFNKEQRETARLALIWSEQYLDGYIDALKNSCTGELEVARRQRKQIRKVRFNHFGKTRLEAMCESTVLVDPHHYMTLQKRCD